MRIRIIKMFVLFLCIFSISTFLTQPVYGYSRIKVSGNRLVDGQNNTFIVRSAQYAKVINPPNNFGFVVWEQDLFNAANYSATTVEQDFQKLQDKGYNSVRLIFHNTIDAGYTDWRTPDSRLGVCREGINKPLSDCVDIRSVDNLVDTLRRAKAHDIHVVLTFLRMTPNAYKTSSQGATNCVLYTQCVRDYGRFLTDLFTYLKSQNVLDSILAIQPEAEPFLYTNPQEFKPVIGDTLNAANGFFVSQPHVVDSSYFPTTKDTWNGQSSPQVRAFINDAFTKGFNYLFDQIKAVDSELLMLYDQFPAYNLRGPDPFWMQWHADDLTISNPNLRADIIAMQLYPDTLQVDDKIATRINFTPGFKTSLGTKPFIIMESGLNKVTTPAENRIPKILDWMRESCEYNSQGWNYFNYSADNFNFVTMTQDNFAVGEALSPKSIPRICDNRQFLYGLPSDTPVVGNWIGGTSKVDSPAIVRGQTWYEKYTLAGDSADNTITVNYSAPAGSRYLACDWDGNGTKTPGVFSQGVWNIRTANTSGDPDLVFSFGAASGDIPVCGDWDGNGTQTVGVFRASSATWYLHNSNSDGFAEIVYQYGNAGDVPVVGHWTGTRVDYPGIFRNGKWLLRNSHSNGNADTTIYFGYVGDKPIVGDWSGSGKSSVGYVRGNQWNLKIEPISGDFDSDGDVDFTDFNIIKTNFSLYSIYDYNAFVSNYRPASSTPVPTPTSSPNPVPTVSPTPTATPSVLAFSYGSVGDKPVVGNWMGGLIDTPAVIRVPATASGRDWHMKNSFTGPFADLSININYSAVAGEYYLACDWNADGIKTPGIVSVLNNTPTWKIKNSNTSGTPDPSLTFMFGNPGDIPICGDWNNDGRQSAGVFRDGAWYLTNDNINAPISFLFGNPGDIPVVGDWNGDGTETVGVFRNGTFYLKNSHTGGNADSTIVFGAQGDTPITGDWTGSGRTSVGVYNNTNWQIRR